MNETRVELPDEIDIDVPNVARVYDCLLGGAHNFASDYMIDAGIRQFLDLGSGITTVGNVHEIAQAAPIHGAGSSTSTRAG